MSNRRMKNAQPENNTDPFSGKIIDHFPIRNKIFRRWSLLLAGISVATLSMVFLVDRLITLSLAIQVYGRAIILNHAPLIYLLFFIGLPFGIIAILSAKNHWNDGITIYAEGFSLKHGIEKQKWIWQDVTSLDTRITHIRFGGSDVSVKVKMAIQDQDGRNLIIKNHYERINDLVAIIRSNILPVLLVHTRLSFVQDYPIRFGDNLKAYSHGIILNDTPHSWHDLDAPMIKKDRLILLTKQHKKIFQSKIHRIKNMDLLIHLIKYPPASADHHQPR